MPDVPKRFGEKLRALRLHCGLSLRELADALAYDAHVYLNLVETGKKSPSLTLVMRTAAFFNVTMDQLARDDLDQQRLVSILAIGYKQGNRVVVGGEELQL